MSGNEQVVYGQLNEQNASEDARAAVFGYRTRSVANDGAGYGVAETNNAVTGYNYWGDPYTFGVAGCCFNDFTRTGGVLGANYSGGYWGALGYKDETQAEWGLYTPSNAFVGGGLRMPAGAASGEVLVTDNGGNGSWQKVNHAQMANPFTIGSSFWTWDISSGYLQIQKTSGYPVAWIDDSTSDRSDCLHISSLGTNPYAWALHASAVGGNAGHFYKNYDDNVYAVTIGALDEGLYVQGDFVVAAGFPKSGVVETSRGREAIRASRRDQRAETRTSHSTGWPAGAAGDSRSARP